MTKKEEVESFLQKLRDKLLIFDIVFRPRSKNIEALAELDILPIDRIKFIKQLSSNNYYTGPNNDTYDNSKPDYYEFGITIQGFEVYVKLSLGLLNKQVDCMSFHIAEKPITYPLKK